jgi:hypothetical protein
LVAEIEFRIHRNDDALLVMPMCHANSLYVFGAFASCGAMTTIYSRKSFDPEHCVRALAESGSTLPLSAAGSNAETAIPRSAGHFSFQSRDESSCSDRL